MKHKYKQWNLKLLEENICTGEESPFNQDSQKKMKGVTK